MQTIDTICRQCGGHFQRPVQRGRPQVRCNSCKEKDDKQIINNMIAAKLGSEDKASSEVNSSSEPIVATEQQEPIKYKTKYDPNLPQLYRVMVGNLGIAFAGNEKPDAVNRYKHYVKASNDGYGQVGFEKVELWELEIASNSYKIIDSFTPDRSK